MFTHAEHGHPTLLHTTKGPHQMAQSTTATYMDLTKGIHPQHTLSAGHCSAIPSSETVLTNLGQAAQWVMACAAKRRGTKRRGTKQHGTNQRGTNQHGVHLARPAGPWPGPALARSETRPWSRGADQAPWVAHLHAWNCPSAIMHEPAAAWPPPPNAVVMGVVSKPSQLRRLTFSVVSPGRTSCTSAAV